MSFRRYLILMTLSTLGAWGAWVVVINAIDPTQSGWLGFFLFYVTLSIALLGTLALLGIAVRIWKKRASLPVRITLKAFRQGLLLTTLFVVSLILFSHGWFRWWTMLLVLFIVGFIELAFVSSQHSLEHKNYSEEA
ncbi:hypothetical protein HZA87_00925 [Candidatus Uhrbacteria bacterium]|nr:hypothetical protein [Candidatus Uhrbacteria bacterium]